MASSPDDDRRRRNLWLALGLGCVGCLVIVVLPIMLALILPVYGRAKQKAQQVTCMANMQALAVALSMYRDDWEGRFPPAATWRDGVAKYVDDPEIWRCPADDLKHPSSYALNANLSGLDGSALSNPGDVVMLFGSASAHPNPSDLGISWPAPGRHLVRGRARGNNVAYADGRVEAKVNLQASDLKPTVNPTP